MANMVVTGGAGFIGSNLVDKLVAGEHEVLVIDNFATGKRENLNPKAKLWQEGEDLLNFFKYKKCFKFDVIFHLAALPRIQPSFANPLETYLANTTGTVIALEMARRHNAKLVYAGSSTAYSNVYLNPYAFTKWNGEECCKLYNSLYNTSVVIARFFNVYGPRQIEDGEFSTVIGIWERQARNKEPLTITGDGEQRRDFTHVSDVVDGLIAMSQNRWNADIFNLGTGTNHSLNEVANMFNCEVKYIPKRLGEAKDTLADISQSLHFLNWRPQHTLKDYLSSGAR